MVERNNFIGSNHLIALKLRVVYIVVGAKLFYGVQGDLRRLSMPIFPAVDRGKADADLLGKLSLAQSQTRANVFYNIGIFHGNSSKIQYNIYHTLL